MAGGKVYFVGAGPGDPGLIPLKGVKALEEADVVVYDRLVSVQLLQHAKSGARFIYCGKEPGHRTITQEEIHEILVREARRGHVVVRLKGGDPSIFGRLGEEAEVCGKRQIPFEVIPGITSGSAAAIYAGIPLTHRNYSSKVALISGHRCASNESKEMNWPAIAKFDTIVVYMGVKQLPHIRKQLLRYGKPPTTPAALIRWGTTSDQRVLTGTVDTIAAQAQEAQFRAPAILVVGEVVKLGETLNWYGRKPLFGKKVLLFGDTHSEQAHASLLTSLGAETAEIPVQPSMAPNADLMMRDLDAYDWIVFADAWEVRYFFAVLPALGWDIRRVKARMVVLDAGARAALAQKGIMADCDFSHIEESSPFHRFRLIDKIKRIHVQRGGRWLILTPEVAELRPSYAAESVSWQPITLYECQLAATGHIKEIFRGRGFDTLWISSIRGLNALQHAVNTQADWVGHLRRIPEVVCVGAYTAEKARDLGWSVSYVFQEGVSIEREIETWQLTNRRGGYVS